MRERLLPNSGTHPAACDIYANKSALVLTWLLNVGISRDSFSLREIARDQNISVGLVQKVLAELVDAGFVRSTGIKTSKTFSLYSPEKLLKSWLNEYSLTRKCRTWTYRSTLQTREEMFEALRKSHLGDEVALTLHAAAEAYRCNNTNLQTLELYILDPTSRTKLEAALGLEPQERGYEVLLIEPYYKSLLKSASEIYKSVKVAPALLAFLDLYHFPLRGLEQAEAMKQRIPELRIVWKKERGR